MPRATWRTLVSSSDADEDDRGRRRDRACVASGLVAGAVLGAFAGVFAPASALFLTLAGTVVGGVAGRLVAFQISVDDWDPPSSHHSYVGAASPDDDFATR
jgi:hypothetical protein